MSGTPWWGWLILIVVVLFLAVWLAVAIVSTRAMRRMGEDWNSRTRNLGRRR